MDRQNRKDKQPLKQPSEEYLQASQEPSFEPKQPQKQLLILDLNGTLISRLKAGSRGYYARPHCNTFFEFIFKHFAVMVWSSARQQSVDIMCKIFEQPLELVWNRNHFELDESQFYSKTETIKDLTRVWQHFSNQYDAKNTIILDDTDAKLVYQPYNLIHISTFNFNNISQGSSDQELLKVIRYLDVLRLQSNVANFIRNNPFNSKNYDIAVNLELDTAMTHYNKKGKMIQTYKCLKRKPSNKIDDDDEEKLQGLLKKKRKHETISSPHKAPHCKDATTIPLRPQTREKLKFIVGSIKQKKKPKKIKEKSYKQ